MLFRENIERCCQYCTHCTVLDEDHVQCAIKGKTELDGSCRKFEYDPCKRIPPKAKAVDFAKYEEYDYSL